MRMMNRKSPYVRAIVVALAVGIGLAACGSSSNVAAKGDSGTGFPDVSLGDDGSGGGINAGDAAIGAQVFSGSNGCLHLGSGCTNGSECCSAVCANGTCNYPSCTADTQACTSNGSCCSQSCVSGKCSPLNMSCKTLGNACSSNSECCSALCVQGTCQASSFCGQPGDACSAAADCCTGACTKAAGQALGTCDTSSPGGPANCGLVDGQLCGGAASDGGVPLNDAGVPPCGGPCCSRACAPWGPTGVLVCQPASGCHVVGDLCTKDSDCCGSAGLPGGSGTPVMCVISAPSTIGVCRNPQGCKPDGDVCKLKTSSCNSSCDCCSGNCEVKDTCKQDNVGVPRCAAEACVNAGGSCATSANCCGGSPCVPNPVAGAMPPYVCSGSQCIAACGTCTNNADCCPGTTCSIATGSTHGMCGPCGGGNDAGVPSDGGVPTGADGAADGNAGTGDAGAGGGGNSCSEFGQLCQTSADCCNGIPCTSGRCEFPTL